MLLSFYSLPPIDSLFFDWNRLCFTIRLPAFNWPSVSRLLHIVFKFMPCVVGLRISAMSPFGFDTIFMRSPEDPEMFIINRSGLYPQTIFLDDDWPAVLLASFLNPPLTWPILKPAARVCDTMLLDSLVLRKPASLHIDFSCLIITFLMNGSRSNLYAECLARGLTTSIF